MGNKDESKGGFGGLVDKAKGMVSDDQVDAASDKVKGVTPDQGDSFVDKGAEQAKKYND